MCISNFERSRTLQKSLVCQGSASTLYVKSDWTVGKPRPGLEHT